MPSGMTAQQILDYTIKRVIKATISLEVAISYINDALIELGGDAFHMDTVPSTAYTAHVWADLPEDCISVINTYDSNGRQYDDYETLPGNIRFYDSGSYTIEYIKVPTLLADDEDGTSYPDCHVLLQMAMPYYLAYRYESTSFPADQDTNSWYQYYQQRVQKALIQIQKPGQINAARNANKLNSAGTTIGAGK